MCKYLVRMAAVSSAGMAAQGRAATSSWKTATWTAVIGAPNAVMGTDKDVSIVGVGIAVMGVTVSTAAMNFVRCKTTGALTVQVRVLVLEPAPAMAMLDA